MRRFVALLALTACATDVRPGIDVHDVPFTACDGDAATFVRQSFLSLVGRRPLSQAEVDVYVDLYNAQHEGNPREAVARAIMTRPEFSERWLETFMDAMRVQRLDDQNEANCWDRTMRATVTDGLAKAVRDGAATGSGDAAGAWTLVDLAKSAIVLDDITPLYRAQLFSMVAHPIEAANVGVKERELARRADFGERFDAAYLHRDIVCLGCHTSERSVTDNDMPSLDRHWPTPGAPEAAVFGMANGIAPDLAHGVFRFADFIDGPDRPWGWTSACGTFSPTVPDDTAMAEGAKLASVTGKQATLYNLEQALMRGFAALRGKLPPIGDTATITDPDTALAWLVTLKITEDVFKRVTGTALTIANYYPRNEAASNLLYTLAARYTESGYSLKALLVAIVTSDYFDRRPADLECGADVATYPAVFDPWVEDGRNGPGDAITAVDARTLLSATSHALEWTEPPLASRFPDYGDTGCDAYDCNEMNGACSRFRQCCTAYEAACVNNGVEPAVQVPFERAIGVFLRSSEAGFRGLDFQARLAWEERYGACAKPRWVQTDFVDALHAAAAADTTATVRDVVLVLKDRLIGEPAIISPEEEAALGALLGSELGMPASTVSLTSARQLCGALLGTPQFLLQGIAGRGGERPRLTPVKADYEAICTDLATRIGITCDGGTLALTP